MECINIDKHCHEKFILQRLRYPLSFWILKYKWKVLLWLLFILANRWLYKFVFECFRFVLCLLFTSHFILSLQEGIFDICAWFVCWINFICSNLMCITCVFWNKGCKFIFIQFVLLSFFNFFNLIIKYSHMAQKLVWFVLENVHVNVTLTV